MRMGAADDFQARTVVQEVRHDASSMDAYLQSRLLARQGNTGGWQALSVFLLKHIRTSMIPP